MQHTCETPRGNADGNGDAPFPPTLSACVRLAVADAKRCADNPRYELDFDMGACHEDVDGKCHVNVPGAVVAQTLDEAPDESVDLSAYVPPWGPPLHALDMVQRGKLHDALDVFYDVWSTEPPRPYRDVVGGSLSSLDNKALDGGWWDSELLRRADLIEQAELHFRLSEAPA